MSTFGHDDGRITGTVISAASELRTPDGTVILTFRVEGTKKASSMRGGNYSVNKQRQIFTCHALAGAAAPARDDRTSGRGLVRLLRSCGLRP